MAAFSTTPLQEADRSSQAALTSPLKTSVEALSNPVVADDEPHVESPSLSTPSARARFEFELGRGNEGTKILMVEWEEDDSTMSIAGSWTVSWESKSHVLPAEEKCASSPTDGAESDELSRTPTTPPRQTSHRLYFLIPSRRQVPATVTLTLKPLDSSAQPVIWKTNPLPAIFPPGLSSPTEQRGRGVLHTMWAKKRLQALELEIQEEAKLNCEGIALHMALSEKDWIIDNFGISAKSPPPLQIKPIQHDTPLSPMTLLSPGGSRLTEKLRGLKLQTTGESPRPDQSTSLVSPEDADIAVPMCEKKRQKIAAGHVAPPNTSIASPQVQQRPVAIPASFLTQASAASMLSLGSVLAGQTFVEPIGQEEEEDELFALPLSPRSPEMTKSPFSFATEDTLRYMGAQRVV